MAYAKLEQLQTTGSFKLRGATNKLMSLSPQEAAAGVITSSTGNHGLGVAAAAKILGIDAEVFLSSQVSQAKQRKNHQAGRENSARRRRSAGRRSRGARGGRQDRAQLRFAL